MQDFLLEVFDSRNTSTTLRIQTTSAEAAKNRAKRLSTVKMFPVVIHTVSKRYFAKYKKGELVEWNL